MSAIYGLTAQDVIDELPANTRGVSSSSAGLSTTQIEGWIALASGVVTALLQRSAALVTEAQTDGTAARAVARDAILAYATAKALGKGANGADPRIAEAWQRWRDAIQQLRDYPTVLGDAQPSRVVSSPLGRRPRDPLSFSRVRW